MTRSTPNQEQRTSLRWEPLNESVRMGEISSCLTALRSLMREIESPLLAAPIQAAMDQVSSLMTRAQFEQFAAGAKPPLQHRRTQRDQAAA